MIQQPSTHDGRSSALALILGQCDFDFSKMSASDKRLHWKILQRVLTQFQLNIQGGKFTANRLQFLAYNCYGFTAADFGATFQTDGGQPMVPLASPIASVLPPNPTASQVASHNAQAVLYETFVTCRDQLKYALEYLYKAEIAHLSHEITGFANVTCSDMYNEAFLVHGRMIEADFATVREATNQPVNRSISAEENIAQILARFKRVSDLGPTHGINEGQKLHQLTTFIVSMHPDVKAIVDRYHAETDTPLRTCDTLLAAVRLGLARLTSQPSLATYGNRAYAATADAVPANEEDYLSDEEPPSAYAATAPSKGGGRPANKTFPPTKAKQGAQMSQEELLKFYEAAPESKYCFAHGWGGHLGKKCYTMTNKKSTFTPAQIDMTKPKYNNGKLAEVDGVLPNVTVLSGFRHLG